MRDAKPALAQLSPGALARRLDRILEAAVELVEQLPADRMGYQRPPGQGPASRAAEEASGPSRTIRDVGFEIFRLSLAFADGMDRGRLSEASSPEPAPAEMIDGADIARYGALARARLDGWFAGVALAEYARRIEVGDGHRSGHELLQGTVWRAARHLRLLAGLAADIGIAPRRPLPGQAFEEEAEASP